jgi:hypothetical protein
MIYDYKNKPEEEKQQQVKKDNSEKVVIKFSHEFKNYTNTLSPIK